MNLRLVPQITSFGLISGCVSPTVMKVDNITLNYVVHLALNPV